MLWYNGNTAEEDDMSNDPFEEENRRSYENLRRHLKDLETARRLGRGGTELDLAIMALLERMATLRDSQDSKKRKRRRGGEPDAGGVPVAPSNHRNLSGGAAVLPETEA